MCVKRGAARRREKPVRRKKRFVLKKLETKSTPPVAFSRVDEEKSAANRWRRSRTISARRGAIAARASSARRSRGGKTTMMSRAQHSTRASGGNVPIRLSSVVSHARLPT
jgi:hypothetical protein